MKIQKVSQAAMEKRAGREAAKEFFKREPRMLDKRAECDLAERNNSWDGPQARKSELS